MAHVVLCSECWPYTAGASELEVEAASLRGLIAELDRRFPGLGAFADRRMAFAVDGEIHQDDWFRALGPASEVYLIPKIGGG